MPTEPILLHIVVDHDHDTNGWISQGYKRLTVCTYLAYIGTGYV